MRLHSIATGLALLGALAVSTFTGQQPAVAKGICPLYVLKVCALNRDGTRSTYNNACFARRAHARVLHVGECFGSFCPFIYDPVCARDPQGFPRTYPNLCLSEKADAVFLRKGDCK
ncbi:Kazal-type serine protease inhibitor domain-containing protein [Afipia sp. GAS231]|uniref:Kazal-type serine protease inhibitor domain-containing protein n=1 Tax=Afipia sp. GAS231 TaxID=1882747 RepID=UPI00087AAD3C|nr:Kazal-type serine protease inhibitor domain-containing protein [Afipia sp. GAS231]SDO58843.1 hypothetical protein SAMN05444050_4512 [Afipia sp. GAS231]